MDVVLVEALVRLLHAPRVRVPVPARACSKPQGQQRVERGGREAVGLTPSDMRVEQDEDGGGARGHRWSAVERRAVAAEHVEDGRGVDVAEVVFRSRAAYG